MTEPVKLNHKQEGVDKLPSQWGDSYDVDNIDFQNPPSIAQRLLQSFLVNTQEAEDNLIDIANSFNVNDAVGKQLDMLGEIRNIPRDGRSDTDYRRDIISEAAASNGSGTISDIINLTASLAGATDVKLFEYFPLGFITHVIAYPDSTIPPQIKRASGAGIDGGYLGFDPEDIAFIPTETLIGVANLTDDLGNQFVTDIGDNLTVDAFLGDALPQERNSFPDPDEGVFRPLATIAYLDTILVDSLGYGNNYGNDYGGTP